MSKFDKAREEWNKLDEDDKIAVVAIGAGGVLFALLILTLIVVLIKELFVPALVLVAFYSVGVRMWNWPVPKKIKQFFVK